MHPAYTHHVYSCVQGFHILNQPSVLSVLVLLSLLVLWSLLALFFTACAVVHAVSFLSVFVIPSDQVHLLAQLSWPSLSTVCDSSAGLQSVAPLPASGSGDGVIHGDGPGILEIKCPFNKGIPGSAAPPKLAQWYYMPQVRPTQICIYASQLRCTGRTDNHACMHVTRVSTSDAVGRYNQEPGTRCAMPLARQAGGSISDTVLQWCHQ